MPPELDDAGGVVILESNNLGVPAIAATSRSRRFLNLSLFQSKRFAGSNSSSAAQHHQHHQRGARVDDSSSSTTTCLGGAGGTFHWQHKKFRDALDCDQPGHDDQSLSKLAAQSEPRGSVDGEPQQAEESGRTKASRWWRIVGRFGGKKNRVREETAQPKEQKKARVTHSGIHFGTHFGTHLKKVVVEEPSGSVRCALPSKFEDLTRIARRDEQKENSRSHYELVEPVLEPMRFVTSDLAYCPAETNAPRESLQLRDDLEDQARVVRECRDVVTQLRSNRGKEQGEVAAELRLLAKDCPPARETLASLGAIAPLVSMLDSSSSFCTHSALLTLYTLAIGNDVNKAAIVDAGVIPRLLTLLRKQWEPTIHEAVVANLLSLSALDRNKTLIGSAGAIPELVQTLKTQKQPICWESLRALYNLSLSQPNIKFFVEGDAATAVMEILKTRDTSNVNAEKALAVLGNMMGVAIGRKCVTEMAQSLEVLIGVLGWGVQFAKCQERAAYILMVIAHHSSYGHRQAMVQKRAIPALLELSLLGSALAQKRAVRILECLREDREQGPRPMSAPMGPPPARKPCKPDYHDPSRIPNHMDPQGSKVVNHMVQQSLEQNLQRIVRRANLPIFEIDGMTRAFSLSGCSSSKSLPF